jgi:hypothetical protein
LRLERARGRGKRGRRGKRRRTCPEMKKVLSIEASMAAAGWRESGATSSAVVLKGESTVVLALR